MPLPEEQPPKVFISYSHDSEAHAQRVLSLAQELRDGGLEATIDQFVHGSPPEGWPRWMQRQVDQADFVLIVCTETYKRRFEGAESPGCGKGVDWEGILLLQKLYDARSLNAKFIPVLMDGAADDDVPLALKPYTHYRLPARYIDLYRFLTRQPFILPRPVGQTKKLVASFGSAASAGPSTSDPPEEHLLKALVSRADQSGHVRVGGGELAAQLEMDVPTIHELMLRMRDEGRFLSFSCKSGGSGGGEYQFALVDLGRP